MACSHHFLFLLSFKYVICFVAYIQVPFLKIKWQIKIESDALEWTFELNRVLLKRGTESGMENGMKRRICNVIYIYPPVFCVCSIYLFIYLFICKDGYYIEQNIGTKTWVKLEFQFVPTLIICNVIQTIFIVAFSTLKS